MRASTAQWALVTLSMLGLSGCQSGMPSWWPGRNKVQYSSASSTPPEGASQYNMPSAQATPYGAQGDHSHGGGYDPSNPGGYSANGYGANNYAAAADAAGQNAYSNAAAGGMNAGAPQSGPYDVGASYQQATGASSPYGNAAAAGAGYGANGYGADAGAGAGAGYNAYSGGASGYPGGAADAYGATGQGAAPYAGGQQPYGDYAAQQTGGYSTPYQGGADPAMQNNPYGAPAAQMADGRAAVGDPAAGGGRYDGAANYNAGGYTGTPESTPYGQGAGGGWGQGAAGQPPVGETGYQPGQTGYNPGLPVTARRAFSPINRLGAPITQTPRRDRPNRTIVRAERATMLPAPAPQREPADTVLREPPGTAQPELADTARTAPAMAARRMEQRPEPPAAAIPTTTRRGSTRPRTWAIAMPRRQIPMLRARILTDANPRSRSYQAL